ncbi:MAG TPA: hypothetical protein VN213_18290 [Solirubrobacteraceae bacterium]|nr:hypothetical protein [Solirubrobacteraceae bacterium]
MTTAEILCAARERIAISKRWAKGWWAYDVQGNKCREDDPQARQWCSAGAVFAVSRSDGWAALEVLAGVVPGRVSDFNDDAATTHAEVLAAFDRAIAAAEAES